MHKHTQSQKDLLDYLASTVNCPFLSDLHTGDWLEDLQKAVQACDASQFSLNEWNRAVQYILQTEQSFSTAEEAKQFLLSRGSKP